MNLLPLKITAATLVAFSAAGLSVRSSLHHLARTNAPGPAKNLAKEGDLEGAMAQARELLAEYRANDMNWDRVDENLLRLPDQIYAQREVDRNTWRFSFYRCKHPIYDEVAFYTDLYVTLTMASAPGSGGVQRGEGVYIVGWKDGRVTQVPVADVRLYPLSSDQAKFVFPGMGEYRSDLIKWVQ